MLLILLRLCQVRLKISPRLREGANEYISEIQNTEMLVSIVIEAGLQTAGVCSVIANHKLIYQQESLCEMHISQKKKQVSSN
jgi:hypothetical protein